MKEKPVMTDTLDELAELLEALHECDAGSKGYAEYHARITALFASRTLTPEEAKDLLDRALFYPPPPILAKLRRISNGN